MKKTINKLLWGVMVMTPGIMILNSYVHLYELSSWEYSILFYGALLIASLFFTEFLIDFLILKKHIYNYVLLSSLLILLIIWIFNDFMPHFRIINPQLSWIVAFSLLAGTWVQLSYKISKRL